MPKQRHYTVTRRFIEGVLKGMSVTFSTTAQFERGKVYGGGHGGSRYLVLDVI